MSKTPIPLASSDEANVQSVTRFQGLTGRGFRQAQSLAIVAIAVTGIVLGLFLRWRSLGSQSLWIDEGYTLWIARFSPRDIWGALQFDTSAPLYYIVVHYWMRAFGESDLWLRALSALLGVASLPWFYCVARKFLIDRTSAILATSLYTISFYQIWYAQEVRCYALLVFLGLISIFCLLSFLETRSPTAFGGFVLSLAAGLYTHNMMLFYLPGFALMWLLYPTARTMRMRLLDLSVAIGSVLLIYAPWVPTLLKQLRGVRASFWVTKPTVRHLLETLCIFLGFDNATFQALFRPHFYTGHLFGFWTWAPMGLAVFIFCVAAGLATTRGADRRRLWALLLFSATPVALIFAISRVSTPLYINRIFLGSGALLPVVLCAPMVFSGGARKKKFQILGVAIVALCAISSLGYLKREQREDWKAATGYLLNLPRTPRLVVTLPDFGQVLTHHYGAGATYPPVEQTGLITTFDPPDLSLEKRVMDSQNANGTTRLEQLSRSKGYTELDFLIASELPPLGYDPLAYLPSHCGSIQVVGFHWLEIRRCFLKPEALKTP